MKEAGAPASRKDIESYEGSLDVGTSTFEVGGRIRHKRHMKGKKEEDRNGR